MKQIFLGLFYIIIIVFVWPCLVIDCSVKAQPFGKDSGAREVSVKYAALLATKTQIENLKTKQITGIIAACRGCILDPEKISSNRNRASSEKLVFAFVKKRMEQDLDQDLERIFLIFSAEGLKLSKREFSKEVKRKFKGQIDKGIQKNLEKNFQNIFREARAEAIGEQLQFLSGYVYPGEKDISEFEDAYVMGWKQIDTQNLKIKLQNKIKNGSNDLLEEVESFAETISQEILSDIYLQMKNQEEALKKPLPEGLVSKDAIRRAIENNVREVIAREKAKGEVKVISYDIRFKGKLYHTSRRISRKIYNIFSFIRSRYVKLSEQKEKERFEKFSGNISMVVCSERELDKIIRSNLNANKNIQASRQNISRVFLDRVKRWVKKEYSVKVPPQEQTRFKRRISGYLQLRELRQILTKRIEELIENDFDLVRERIASEQLDKYFPRIADYSWEIPKLSKPEHKHKQDIMRKIKIDRDLNVNGFEDCIHEPLLEEIFKGQWQDSIRDQLLEETERKVEIRCKELIYEGEKAWDGQREIYELNGKLIKSIKNKFGHWIDVGKLMKSKLKQETEKRGKDYWVDYFKKKIYETWERNRVSLIWGEQPPVYSRHKYEQLYEYIEKEIEESLNNTVGQVLESTALGQRPSAGEMAKNSLPEVSVRSEVGGESKIKPLTFTTDAKTVGGSAARKGGTGARWIYLPPNWLKVFFILLIILVVIEAILIIWLIRRQVEPPLAFEVFPAEDGYKGESGKYRIFVKTGSEGTPESVSFSIIQ